MVSSDTRIIRGLVCGDSSLVRNLTGWGQIEVVLEDEKVFGG